MCGLAEAEGEAEEEDEEKEEGGGGGMDRSVRKTLRTTCCDFVA